MTHQHPARPSGEVADGIFGISQKTTQEFTGMVPNPPKLFSADPAEKQATASPSTRAPARKTPESSPTSAPPRPGIEITLIASTASRLAKQEQHDHQDQDQHVRGSPPEVLGSSGSPSGQGVGQSVVRAPCVDLAGEDGRTSPSTTASSREKTKIAVEVGEKPPHTSNLGRGPRGLSREISETEADPTRPPMTTATDAPSVTMQDPPPTPSAPTQRRTLILTGFSGASWNLKWWLLFN